MKQNKESTFIRNGFTNFYSAIHLIVITFIVFILYICLKDKWVFFTWHPMLASTGWVFLVTEGVFMFSPYNKLTSKLSHSTKVKYHWMIQSTGAACTIAAYIIIYNNKEFVNKPHFQSWHGLMGLSTVITCYIGSITGVFALYGSALKKYISPINSKLIHRISGTISFAAGMLTILLSLCTSWLQQKTYQTVLLVWFITILTVLFVTVSYPLATMYRKLRSKL